jgi:hemoglobin
MTATQHATAARDAKRRHAEALGIDEAFVARMIERFYAKVRQDDVLGPIFAAHVVDWTPHLVQMNRFWRSVLFSSGEFAGNPMLKHVVIPDLSRADFARWLTLFEETLGEIGTDAARDHVIERARNIANSLLSAAIVHRGGGLGPSKADML